MASLTEVSINSRKFLKIFAIVIVSFIVLKTGSNIVISYWQTKNPPKLPPPTVRFGKIPKLKLDKILHTSNYQFKLETPTNTLPTLSDRANVYYSPFSKPNLLALEKAKQQALNLGFSNPEKKITEKIYQWQGDNTFLEMNIFNGSFAINYNWQQDQNLLNKRLTMTPNEAIIEAKQILVRAKLLAEDLPDENIKTEFIKISGQKLVPAVSQSEASFIKIDFYRQNIDDLPVKTIEDETGVIQIILAGTRLAKNGLIRLNYSYFPIDYGSLSDYPLKNSANLWNQFSAGGGYVISEVKNDNKDVTIRRVYLGYLDTLEEQKFMQPVLYMQGDNGFLGFVPALDDEVLQ